MSFRTTLFITLAVSILLVVAAVGVGWFLAGKVLTTQSQALARARQFALMQQRSGYEMELFRLDRDGRHLDQLAMLADSVHGMIAPELVMRTGLSGADVTRTLADARRNLNLISRTAREPGESESIPGTLGAAVARNQGFLDELNVLGAQRFADFSRVATSWFVAICAFCALLVGGLGFWTFRTAAVPLHRLATDARSVSETMDFGRRLTVIGKGEIPEVARAFNRMLVRTQDYFARVREAVDRIKAAASTISAETGRQASGTASQSAAITQITAAIHELSATSNGIASSADEVNRRAKETLSGIEETKARLDATGKLVLALAEKSQTIGRITALIDDLADQTNILALNASIEAARAGESGRGFAVVAGEIQRLAEKSASETEEIRKLLAAVQQDSSAAIMSLEELDKWVESVLEQTKVATASVEGISESVAQQRLSTEELVRTAQGIESSVQDIVQSSRDTAGSASKLKLLAVFLEDAFRSGGEPRLEGTKA